MVERILNLNNIFYCFFYKCTDDGQNNECFLILECNNWKNHSIVVVVLN